MTPEFNAFMKLIEQVAPAMEKYIIYDVDNSYILYDKYQITKSGIMWNVERFRDGVIKEFNKLRHATAWAILDNYGKYHESRRIADLDGALVSIISEIMLHKKLQWSGRPDIREINRDKYLVSSDKQRQIQWELDKYIHMAKICQEKGYQNELTRTTRK